MAELLDLVDLRPQVRRVPVAMAFSVDPNSAPYLVASSTGFVWVPQANGGVLRSSVRIGAVLEDLYNEIVQEVMTTGRDQQWGNSLGLDPQGLREAIEHLNHYELDEAVILANPNFDWSGWPEISLDIEDAEWLSTNRLLVVTQDRAFLGFAGLVGEADFVVVVHNPSRGMAVLQGSEDGDGELAPERIGGDDPVEGDGDVPSGPGSET